MKITRKFSFSAAHHLTDYCGACERVHGHTYHLSVTVQGPVQKNGLVLDFVELKRVVQDKVLSQMDHMDLNNILKNPSAENISVWIWDKLKNIGKETGSKAKLVEIKLWEGDNTYVTYDGN